MLGPLSFGWSFVESPALRINGPNLKLNIYYGIAKVKWQRQHGTMKFTPAHMNSVLVEMWHYFQKQSASFIIDSLKNEAPAPHPT